MRGTHIVWVFLVIAGLVLPCVAEASGVRRTIADLVGDSDLVVHGKVRGSQSYWLDDIIVTEHTVQVMTPVLGNAGAGNVPVIVPGGVVGDLGLQVSGQPDLGRGDEAVLFLEGAGPGEFAVVGGVDVARGRVPAFGMDLDEFIGRVQGGGVGLEEREAKPEKPPGKPDKPDSSGDCFKLTRLDWKKNGDLFDGKYHPGLEDGGYHWSINNVSQDFGDAELKAALESAAAVWNDTAGACWGLGDPDPTITHDTGLTGARYDGRNAISFGDTGSAVAVVSNWYLRKDRRAIIETDMTFNDVDWDFGIGVCGSDTEFDLENVAVHEFGHWISLDDQYEDAYILNTMYGYVAEGECDKITLEPCDRDGAQAVYGACP